MAVGDSYTAGPLVPELRLDPSSCLRSTHNYPAYLAAYLRVRTYVDVSCSGAQTRDVFTRQSASFGSETSTLPPQIDAVRPGTDLVSVGLGGNDFDLFTTLTRQCSGVAEDDPTGSPCRASFTSGASDTETDDATAVRSRVDRVVRAVHNRAPRAKILVIGYPQVVAPGRTCDAVPFATGDYAWVDGVERVLNTSLRHAAEANDATYVDVYRDSRGHDACAGQDAWINGATGDSSRAAAFHPFAVGMRGAAAAAYTTLTGKPAPQRAPFDSGAPTP